jgi:hypothetical protein
MKILDRFVSFISLGRTGAALSSRAQAATVFEFIFSIRKLSLPKALCIFYAATYNS